MGAYKHRLAELSAARERVGRRTAGHRASASRRPVLAPRRASAPARREVRIGTVIPSRYVPPPPPPPPDYDPPPPSLDVEDRRKRSAMQTQSLLFSRAEGWTVEKAKVWAKKHGHKSNKVDVTDQYVRLRQLDPKGFQVKRTVPFGKGIRAVVAREETMPTKKKSKTTRRPAAKRTAAKRKPAARKHAAKHKATPKRSAARK